jgi:ketosteroid isomerase-like protein
MAALWSEEHPVSCLHPGSVALLGRKAVLDAWRGMLSEPLPFVMRCHGPQVQLIGETALVIAYEGNDDQPAHLAVTNVFVLERGRWRMVHHHAAPLSRPIVLPSAAAN